MIEIIIMGSRKIRHRTGCCCSRSQEEIIIGFIPTLYRTFGQRNLRCRYVDIDDPKGQEYPHAVQAVRNKTMGLPLAIRGQEIILHGQATLFQLPDYIRAELKKGTPTS